MSKLGSIHLNEKERALILYKFGKKLIKHGHADGKICLQALDAKEYLVSTFKLGTLAQEDGNNQKAKEYFMKLISCADETDFDKLPIYYAISSAYDSLIKIYKSEYQSTESEPEITEEFAIFLSIKRFRSRLPTIFRILASLYDQGEIEAINLDVQYTPDRDGVNKAKKDFETRINQII